MWAQEIRAFVNLEACGSGGRELVFQTGPGHPWLVEAYANVAPHPFASVIGQEIFQSGIIPGTLTKTNLYIFFFISRFVINSITYKLPICSVCHTPEKF